MIPSTDSIPFGEWLPDLGNFNNPGALTALNVLCQNELYKPFGDAQETGNALSGKCFGGFSYRDASGTVQSFAATATKIYKRNGNAWDDVTRVSGGDYTTGIDDFWEFISFGTLIIATNYNDDIQVFDVTSSTNFEQLSATAPRCRRFFILRNYLVCVDTVDGDGAIPYRVRWGPLANPRGVWTDDPTVTGADHQDIYGGDYPNVFGAALQDFGVIVQGKQLWRMDYVGGDQIFTFTPVATGTGSLLPRSCISDGDSVFGLGEDGWWQFDGSASIPIGYGKIDKTFYALFDETYDYNLNAVVDPLKKNILWSFPSNSAIGGGCDYILCYHQPMKRFTLIEQTADVLMRFLSIGYTLEGLDAVSTNLDTLPFSLDSRVWTGGKTILGCITENHILAAFNGNPKEATIGTPEVRINRSGRTLLQGITPYIEGGTFSARCGSRNRIADTVSYTAFVNQNSYTGECDFGKDAVFHRVEVKLTGSWETAIGIAPRAKNSGVA